MPCFLNFLDLENEFSIEITERVAQIFGEVLHSLTKFGLHLKYKEQVITYYKSLCSHKED